MRAAAIASAAVLFSALLPACGGARPRPRVDEATTAERSTLADLSGRPLTLSEHVGRDVLLLAFWTTDCEPCGDALRFAGALHAAYADFGLHVLAVSLDARSHLDRVQREVDRRALGARVVIDDGSIAEAWNPEGVVPSLVLLDREGRVAWRSDEFDLARAGTLEVEVRRLVEPVPASKNAE
ncbi:MAG: TlpA disulfide reductase family protein [Myxococcota bacterium]